MLTKERIARIKECKKLVVKLPLETAIQLEKTENDLVIANRENERLQKECNALEFHLKVSSKALESESEKADTFQHALEKIYDDIGVLTSQEIFQIVEDALDGTMPLGGGDE